MLRIRDDQIEALRKPALEDFKDEMFLHLHEFFPDECARMGALSVRAFVEDGIRRADGYQVFSPRGVCKYLNLMMALGPDFDTAPKTAPWVQPILTDTSIPDTTARMDLLSEEAIQRLTAEEGEGEPNEFDGETQEMRSP